MWHAKKVVPFSGILFERSYVIISGHMEGILECSIIKSLVRGIGGFPITDLAVCTTPYMDIKVTTTDISRESCGTGMLGFPNAYAGFNVFMYRSTFLRVPIVINENY